ncbi:MAG: hypothetical protein FWB91_02535 [Defluviitaleaceae bacterium]|nr:hypothetical protein [Defluviitaleaceae bacterium]
MNDDILNLILVKLTSLEEGQTRIETEVVDVRKEVVTLSEEVASLSEEVASLSEEVAALNEKYLILDDKTDILSEGLARVSESVAVIEVEHGRSLGALHDGYKSTSDAIKHIKPIVEATAEDVALVKIAVSSHTKVFNALKSAI